MREDRHAVDHSLEIAEDVRGEDDGASAGAGDFEDAVEEIAAGQHVEARGGFIHHQQIGLLAQGQQDAERPLLAF